MKVFVTGATGFVGRYVVKELLSKGYEVHAGVRNLSKLYSLFGEKVRGYEVNFENKDSLKKVLNEVKPDFVIHLIGILYENKKKGETFVKVHYLFTRNLVEVSKDSGVKKFLFMSALGTHDEAPSMYHQTKRWAEKELIASGLNYTIFRPSLILGPEQRLFYDMYKLTSIVPFIVLPDGGKYPFQPVDVRDVACAYVKALEDSSTDRKIYELCGTKVINLRDLLKIIFEHWNRHIAIIPAPKRVMYYLGKFLEAIMAQPPFTSDQVLMMWKPNVCGEINDEAISDGVRKICGRSPVPFEDSIKWCLESFRT